MNQDFPFDREPISRPIYAEMDVNSEYLKMKDGTRLAADIYLPLELEGGDRIPAILYQTRYWRAMDLRAPWRWLLRGEGDLVPATREGKAFFVKRGYAVVVVDVRGTGASFGVSNYPWEEVTVRDAREILDWIMRQPWSNGKVAGIGVSFLGTTAELLLATGHPALKAVIPQFNHPDPYTDIAMPGGLANERFVRAWTELNYSLDRNLIPESFGAVMKMVGQGVKPVGGAAGHKDLQAAVEEHSSNSSPQDLEVDFAFRDEPHPVKGYSLDDQAVMRFRETISNSQVPVFSWASWMDAGTAGAALRRFTTFSNPQRVVIGAWNHGGLKKSSPYPDAKPDEAHTNAFMQREVLRFLDTFLKTGPDAAVPEKQIYYYTLGAERWQSAPSWPPPGVQLQRWYLQPGFRLGPEQPAEEGTDTYTVDFRASTGTYNRWWELGVVKGKPVDYGDRASQRPYVLGYESEPLGEDMEISGSPTISLYVSSSEPDTAFYVYLEDVMPDGRIVHLTEGQLRAIHHIVCPPSESPYRLQIPYHSFRSADAQPLKLGEMTKITFGLLPVSALIRRGHRVRVALAGHDAGTFPRIPKQGDPVWTIGRSRLHPSSVELPVQGKR